MLCAGQLCPPSTPLPPNLYGTIHEWPLIEYGLKVQPLIASINLFVISIKTFVCTFDWSITFRPCLSNCTVCRLWLPAPIFLSHSRPAGDLFPAGVSPNWAKKWAMPRPENRWVFVFRMKVFVSYQYQDMYVMSSQVIHKMYFEIACNGAWLLYKCSE